MTDTSVAPIREPFDALAARMALIDEATRELDLQYYQWDSDAVGCLLLERLIAAADRGVEVRLLVDDLRFRRRTHAAASLSVHPHISLRLFNPMWSRRSNVVTEAIESLARLSQLNRRMHNKLLIADRVRAIAGGRNIADAHYGLHEAFNLVDFDVLIVGDGVVGLHETFGRYWTSGPAVRASTLTGPVAPSDLEAVRSSISERVNQRAGLIPAELATDTSWRRRVAARTVTLGENDLEITTDTPGPTSDTRPTQVIEALHAAVAGARRELVVVTPFFVPNEMDVDFYRQLVERGVHIRLLTNSLASNSGTISNSGLNRTRKGVVEAGVELYELRADAAAKPTWETPPNVGNYLGLHAKLYTIDRERVFLGSVNLDPRSKYINTETGLLVVNTEFAREIADGIETLMAAENAWRVQIDDDGNPIWIDATETTRRQPARSVGQRIADRIFEVLPIDSYI